eukprot:TRINITY_DN1426_c1_g1_i3.p1 TRINITY_DN1426_c1_g1~~TRINITY_DN1426_c1_g1_i3.p1  ORF type:complete len:359 (+),score=51.81 TRINITY_DN1426_c1_g1_i3:57-1133(+)
MSEKPEKGVEKKGTIPQLLWGAGGIYACYMYYGSLQEDVFRFKDADGGKFTYVWFLQILEAAANVLVSFTMLAITGFTRGIPHELFSVTGFTQVLSKWCTNSALKYGVSFPVATLAKSAKMIPVMIGSLLLGGATYTLRDYAQVAAIVIGTSVVSLGSGKKDTPESTYLGMFMLAGSLACDGLTGGVQKRLKAKTAEKNIKLKAYDFMFWTNLYMLLVAIVAAFMNSEISAAIEFCNKDSRIMWLIIKFSICSALGQSFIFFTISTFDPLVNATVTTTRKIFSVIYSILFKGNSLSPIGWFGVAIACAGVLADISDKAQASQKTVAPKNKGLCVLQRKGVIIALACFLYLLFLIRFVF